MTKSTAAGSGRQRLNSVKLVSMPPPTSASGKAARTAATRSNRPRRRPGALGLVAAKVGAGQGDGAARPHAGSGTSGGDGGDVFGSVGDDLEGDRGIDRPGEIGAARVDPQQQAVDPELGEAGRRRAVGQAGLVGEQDRGHPGHDAGGGSGRDRMGRGAGESDPQRLADRVAGVEPVGAGRESGRQ